MSLKKIKKMLKEAGYSDKAIKEILWLYGLGERKKNQRFALKIEDSAR